MKKINQKSQRLLLGALGWILLSSLVACTRRSDPAVASAGGGVSPQRVVLTMKGAAQ